jgi:hypothetical protein
MFTIECMRGLARLWMFRPALVSAGRLAALDADLARLRTFQTAVVERERGLVDGSAVVEELREIAGEKYPALVQEWIAQSRENGELEQRATVAEREVTALCALVLAEVHGDRDTTEGDN